jgi:hypothetical protein
MSQPSAPAYDRLAIGASLLIAPLFLLFSSVVLPRLESDNGAQLRLAAEHHQRYYLFVLFGIVGTVFLFPAFYGLMQETRSRSSKLGIVGGTLALIGTALALVDYGTEFVKWQMSSSPAERRAMTAVLERFDASAGSAVPLQISGIAVLIGIVVLAIGLVRGRRAPVWVALGLVAGIFMNLLGFASGSLVLLDASGLVLLVAMAEPARRILSQAPLKNR